MQRAEQLIKQAEKALESGWFTKRDPDTGMDAYLKAANLLRTENPLRASECYVKAAELQQELNSLFLSAKSFEQAAALCGDPKLYKRASDMYLVHGSGDRAAEMLEKAALMQDASTAAGKQQALELYKESLEIYSSEDKLRFSLDTHRNAIKFSIANSLLQDAIQLSKQLELVMIKISNRPGAFKQALSTLVLNVHINNANAQQEWGESCSRYYW
jgi:tetratricopeptide (TPR) repeat protein